MITAFIAAAAMLVVDDKPMTCPVMSGNPAKAGGPAVEWQGIKFTMCCGGCDASFSKDPAKYLKTAAEKGTVVGASLFDPVTGMRVNEPKITSDYKGVRYAFANDTDKAEFAKDPAKYTKMPEKVVMTCPVSGEAVSSYGAAGGYVDYKGVRYFACCMDCMLSLHKDIATLSKKFESKAVKPMAMASKGDKSHGHGG
ncbi:MAG: hypothetical protein KF857_05040 [Fimbriimonadaceae bacterium]|nr:hypothetical protein [Fimbriimonadaceae bacterium]